MPTVAIDWDDTLVGYKKYGEPGAWLPGAPRLLRKLRSEGYAVTINSCRANWPEGRVEIETKLATIGLGLSSRLKIAEGKPLAVVYVDDRAFRFRGDWTVDESLLRGQLREAK